MFRRGLLYGLSLPFAVVFGMAGSVSAETVLSITQTAYDANDRPVCQAVRMNLSTSATDACQYGTSGTTGPDRISLTRYDADGNVIEVKRGQYVNGSANEQVIYATYGYTKNGVKTFEADANGNVTEFLYDGFDRLSRMNYPSSGGAFSKAPCAASSKVYTGALGDVGPSGCANAQAYTTRGAPPSGALINPAPLLGDVNTADGTSGDYETFQYDKNGNKTFWRRRNGQTHSYDYDALNRQWKDTPSQGQAVVTVYDLKSRMCDKIFTLDTWASGDDCGTRYGNVTTAGIHNTYDKAGRLLMTKDANDQVLSYMFNEAGGRTRLTYPDGTYVGYTLDVSGRMTAAGLNANSGMFAQAYNNEGQRISLTRGGGSTSYQYDGLGRIEHLTHSFSSTGNNITWDFAYNPASQVTNLSSTNALYDYTQKTKPLETRTYDGLNRDTSIAQTGGYDANGNLANEGEGGRVMTYDMDNRLLTVVKAGANVALTYDPEGRLSSYTLNGTMTKFLYDGVNLIGEYNGSGVVQRRYVHGAGTDEPLVWFEGSGTATVRYLYANYQGSVIGWTNSSGVVQETYRYDPWGTPYVNNGQDPAWTGSRFTYTGQTRLDGVELYYYKARVYDPVRGRFFQTDPIGTKDDINLYAYVAGDPINRSDPSGLTTLQIGVEVNAVAKLFGVGVGDKEEVGVALEVTKDGVDVGLYRTASDSLEGLMISAGPTAAASIDGTFDDLRGEAYTETACVGLCLSKSTPSNPKHSSAATDGGPKAKGRSAVEVEVEVKGKVGGKTKLGVGASRGKTNTEMVTVKQAVRSAKDSWNGFKKGVSNFVCRMSNPKCGK